MIPVEYPLANISKVELETDSETYELTDVASEADITAYLSEGTENVLRVKNAIKAQNRTEDIALGYDIRLVAVTFIPKVLELVDGGTWTEGEQKYVAPVVGRAVERTPFTLNVYTEEKDGDGETKSIVKFVYKNCKGHPINYSLRDGEFFAPEFTIKSRSKVDESPAEVYFLDLNENPVSKVYVAYEEQDSVKNISPVTVIYGDGAFEVPLNVYEFTFEDDTTSYTAKLYKGTWTIV